MEPLLLCKQQMYMPEVHHEEDKNAWLQLLEFAEIYWGLPDWLSIIQGLMNGQYIKLDYARVKAANVREWHGSFVGQ